MTAKRHSRRRLLRWVGGWLGLAGMTAPFAIAAQGALPRIRRGREDPQPVEVPLADVPPGEMLQVEWRGKPIFVRHRTAAEIARERAVPVASLRDPETDQARTRRPEWVVVEGICTHGGCIPNGPLGDFGGWYCLCHGSQFDTAGRVRAGPARENLKIPPHEFVSELVLRVGP